MPKDKKNTIVVISTYPPRECGIATYSSDLVENFDRVYSDGVTTGVVALESDILAHLSYGKKVVMKISENNQSDYIETRDKINAMRDVSLVLIEHEFGIFGDDYGKNILTFLQGLNKPVVITLHTVLPHPGDEMKALMEALVARADRLIVMTEASKKILHEVYGVLEEKVRIIPHGLHFAPYRDTTDAKAHLGLTGKHVLSTFGLLSRGKGIEYGIAALQKIVQIYPDTVYLVIGATHPVILSHEGERYREFLEETVRRLGLEKNVIFYNEYFNVPKLLDFLQATDIYLSLVQDPDQAVSGTLTYALGAGRPVISTPFTQAREVVTPEIGRLISFGESEGIEKEVCALLSDPSLLLSMGRAAYFRTRSMAWQNVALSHMRVFRELSPQIARKEKNVPPISLVHFRRLTDSFGMFQFAVLDEPDPEWGYTLDDNARALIVAIRYWDTSGDTTILPLIKIYLDFMERSMKSSGGFINYFTKEGLPDVERNQNENLDDANARALYALSVAATSSIGQAEKDQAKEIFSLRSHLKETLHSPRAIAFYIKALGTWLTEHNDDGVRTILEEYARVLIAHYEHVASDEWQWFEEVLSYSNGVLPEALLVAFVATGKQRYFDVAQATLDFLVTKSFDGDLCAPVGQAGWLKRGGTKHIFDQQPEEVAALVCVLGAMYQISHEEKYEQKIDLAFDWFLGNNVHHQTMCTPDGGCYDGILEKEINLNQGAESTLSYLLARFAIEK